MNRLVLSIFPGIDILGKGFEEQGYCVVRGPDRLWGGDIKMFHPPAGIFEGVIGGPPCQEFSRMNNVNRFHNRGIKPKWGNLIPEFERVVKEASPEWFVMENIKEAPLPEVEGYTVDVTLLNNRWLGGEQNRVHRFSFGSRRGLKLVYELAVFESLKWHPRVCASGGTKPGAPKDRQTRLKYQGWRTAAALKVSLRLQGLPEGFLDDAPFTLKGKHSVIGNAVSLLMARALASAVKAATASSGLPAR